VPFIRLHLLLWLAFAALAQIPPGYYAGTESLSGLPLRLGLHAIVRGHKVIPYSSGTRLDVSDALTVLDEDSQDTNRVRLLYGNTNTLKSNFGETTGWNREHSWPNSYGIDSEGPAYSDLHHLFACDANVNSSRGNKFYDRSWAGDGNLANPAHVEAVGSSTDRDSWQPPNDQRGNLARALLYMEVRYAGDVAGELDLELTDDLSLVTSTNRHMGRLTTLLCWHLLDPVDDRERQRNEGVFLLQTNRNPFVDHPEFVALVFGDPPRLNIQVGNGQVQLTWPSALEGQLLESSDLKEWQPVGSGIQVGKWTNLLPVGLERPLNLNRLVWP
jgi:endonuclease I